jgi:DNA repair protein RadC
MKKGKLLRNNEDILACLKYIRNKKQEYVVCLSLDSGMRLIARRTVTIGLLDASLIHPREVFAAPLKDRAKAIIVAHNHPSGIAEPSRDDIEATSYLVSAGLILKIPLRDHLIVTRDEYYSFRGHGMI